MSLCGDRSRRRSERGVTNDCGFSGSEPTPRQQARRRRCAHAGTVVTFDDALCTVLPSLEPTALSGTNGRRGERLDGAEDSLVRGPADT